MKLDARAGVGTVAASIRTGWGWGGVGAEGWTRAAAAARKGGGDADRKRYLDSMM